ncbi:hypothetical protein MKK63_11725 [Methylobacterium sp. J-088]|uniref:hypothetical protein n=1 Tax=Methylobacterium sp. J-088 TaxID=2836664 RepID=UPI001FBA07C0|nr:hypothetical protein [Methylobacterium sp. J-088]MCJ2063378.1 hypothetical protein [Methylobacterium sp. J-088]
MITALVRTGAAIVCSLASGCIGVGPASISSNRAYYNDVLIDTNNQQLLRNIVRVSVQEQPAFTDVAEINATTSVQTSPMGGVTNIGALAGFLGSASSGLTYNESPVVKYVPLQGTALIAQFGSPFPGLAIVTLQNTEWPLSSILEFVVNTLTPSYLDNYRAVDALVALNNLGALEINITDNPATIVIKFKPNGVISDRTIAKSGKQDRTIACLYKKGGSRPADRLWTQLRDIFKQPYRDHIIISSNQSIKGSAVFKTRSALGALKLADANDFLFTSPEIASQVREGNLRSDCFNESYYYFTSDTDPNDPDRINALWYEDASNVFGIGGLQDSRDTAYKLGHTRTFIIIERSEYPPENAYVSIPYKGKWYSINSSDKLSKLNFSFLNELLTLQAIPDPGKLTQTVIPVGGGLAVK